MRKLYLLLVFLIFAGIQVIQAQTKDISGTVTSSEDGQGIPGVNIVVKGTTFGTVTDLDGKYKLSAPEDATTLVFKFVGMVTKEVEIGGKSVINVTLEPTAEELSGVVVTALGISREKKTLGYSVQEVGGDEISTVREANPINSLSGRVAGVNILQSNTMGGSANVVIRGYNSLTQNNQPLFVIDGVPLNNNNTNEDRIVANSSSSNQNDGWGGYDYGNAAMDINPDDIENVSVLKGAAATALYGQRAANGVVLITTKKGTSAPGKGPIGITINSGFQMSQIDPSTMPKHQNKYGGGYGPFYENEGVEGVDDYYFFYADIDGDGTDDLIVPTSEDASWGAPFDPNLNVIHWDALDPLADNYGEKRPWVASPNGIDYFFQTGMRYINSIAFDGATDKGSFRLSYTNYDETGILPNSSIKKNTINFSGDYKFTKRLDVEAGINYVNTKAVGRYGTGYSGQNVMQSFGQWIQTNVDFARLEEKYLRADGNQLSWNHGYYDDIHPIYFDNPYWVRYMNYEDDQRDRVFGYTALNYELADWLNFSGRVSLDHYGEVQNERIAVGSVDQAYYSKFNRSFTELNTDLMLNFNKHFDKISLSGVIGANNRDVVIEQTLNETVGGLVVPGLYSISNSVSPISVTEGLKKYNTNSIYAQASVGYNDFVYVELTDRYDESSTLPSDNNGYNYWSASGSLILSEIAGLKDQSWLSFAKLRANYAEVGGDAPVYSVFSTYSQNTSWGDLALMSVNSTLQNPNLLPERTKAYEVGLEINLFNQRLFLDVAAYKENSFNQILNVLVDDASGYNRQWVNGGEIQNQGIEVAFVGTPVKTNNFSWDIGVNWFKNQNEVISLYQDADGNAVDNMLIYSAWDVSINATPGQPYGVIKGTDFVYTNGEKTVGEDGYYLYATDEDGNVIEDAVIGNIQPDWNMSLNSSMNYKGFGFNFLFDMQQGGDIYSVNTKYGQATGVYEETAEDNVLGNPMRDNLVSLVDGDLGPNYSGGLPLDEADPTSGGYILPGVKEDGTDNDILVNSGRWGRAFYYNNSPTARYVFDASYIKLREVSISYSLPSSLVSKTPLSQIVVSLVGRNLAILHKNTKHFDPEASLGSGNQQGIETGSYPTTRTFGFNLKLGI